jgi:hypothetical protein
MEPPPKNGRIDKYSQECTIRLKEIMMSSNKDKLDEFMLYIFKDCKMYLQRELGVCFPSICITFYNKEKYMKLYEELNLICGVRPYTGATTYNLGNGWNIGINVQEYYSNTPVDFTINLCVSYIEELTHIIYPTKSELEVHDLLCDLIDDFLEMKLPEEVKKARLNYAKKCIERS